MKGIVLERLKKYCSHSVLKNESAVFLVFGFVLAQLQGFSNLRPRQSLAKNQKSSRRIGYSISLTALIPIVALFFATGCKPSGGSSQPISTNASANATNVDNVPYYGAMIKAQRNATSTADMASLKPAIEQFQVEKGRFPKDLNELVTEKYISKVPDAPYGFKLDYDASTGTVKVVPQ